MQVIPEETYKTKAFPKSKNLPEIKLFSAQHRLQDSQEIAKALNDKQIVGDKPVILVGNTPKAFVVKAVLDHKGFSNVRICELNFDQWKKNADAAAEKKAKEEPTP